MIRILLTLLICITPWTNSYANSSEDKLFIVDLVETGRDIEESYVIGYFYGEELRQEIRLQELRINYHLTLNDGSLADLTAVWANGGLIQKLSVDHNRPISMYHHFFLERGDELEFSSYDRPIRDLENFVYFSIYRDGIFLGKFQGFLQRHPQPMNAALISN